MKTTYHKPVIKDDHLADERHDDGAAVCHSDDRVTDEAADHLCSGKGISTAEREDESSSELEEVQED